MFGRLFALLILMVATISSATPASAQDLDVFGPTEESIHEKMNTIAAVETIGGMLTLDEFDGWGFLHFKGRTIAREFASHMHIFSQLPKAGKAEFVFYYIWNGGNCCEPDLFLLDAGTNPPKTFPIRQMDEGQLKIIRHAPGTVTIRVWSDETTRLGDPIRDTLQYERAKGDFALIRHSAVTNYMSFNRDIPGNKGIREPPSAVLDDPLARYPLVELIGVERFARFRGKMQIYNAFVGIKVIEGRYLLGDASSNTWGNSGRGMYVIDTFFDRAWALQAERDDEDFERAPAITAWGTLEEADTIVRHLLDDWLLYYGKETAWQAGSIQIVDGLTPAPFPPTWHPRLPDTMQPY